MVGPGQVRTSKDWARGRFRSGAVSRVMKAILLVVAMTVQSCR